ncbi:hypothetical protein [Sphingobium sp. DC-2]|uniref:hypothetical protein n=1 Tax=Sphingobium sp. DC-2 TaxID=1303256 RepID=UPI0012DE6857|nr:hypothetical protein [Sphingobium sp. DC-2]
MAISAVTFLCELEPDQRISRVERRRYRCFEDTAIVSYCRPFTQSKGLPTLSLKKLGVKPTTEQQVLHDRLWERRNKVVAHTDIDRMRLAMSSFQPFDDHPVMLPMMDFDDGLAFFNERHEWEEWVQLLIHRATKSVFDRVQGRLPIRFRRDHADDR